MGNIPLYQAEDMGINAAQHCLKNCPCISALYAHENTQGLLRIYVKCLVLGRPTAACA